MKKRISRNIMKLTFGQTLRQLRQRVDVTQRDLANRIGMDFSYISKLENDRMPPPSADTIVAICRELNESPEQLLALVGKIPTDVEEAVAGEVEKLSLQKKLIAAQLKLVALQKERQEKILNQALANIKGKKDLETKLADLRKNITDAEATIPPQFRGMVPQSGAGEIIKKEENRDVRLAVILEQDVKSLAAQIEGINPLTENISQQIAILGIAPEIIIQYAGDITAKEKKVEGVGGKVPKIEGKFVLLFIKIGKSV